METYNIAPYYDDFDETKNFHQIMFKPGYAVQARELTQLQTILQSQIERFGKHIFREGSVVLGGQFNIETDVAYVKITNDYTVSELNALIGKTVTGTTTGIRAYVYTVADKTTWGASQDVLMVRYLSAGTTTAVFAAGESLQVENGTTLLTVGSSTPTGVGSVFSIEEGVVFSRGYFVRFEKQNIVLNPLSSTPTCKIGFDSAVSLVDAIDDATLLDNAQGSYNYAAPGADRLVLIPSLKRVSITDTSGLPNYISLFTISNGVLVETKERTEYSRIYDEIAKRTYDESGDYVVNGLGVRVREHLDTGTNEGYLTSSDGGDANLLAVGVEPGLAYVKGYEVNNRVTKYVEVEKSSDYQSVNSELVSARSGNYIVVNEVVGSLDLDTAPLVELYDTAELRVTGRISNTTTPSGVQIGTAKVKNMEFDSAGQYRVYLFDIKMETNYNIADVRGISTTSFFADTVLENGKTVVKDTLQNTLIYPLGSGYIRNVKDTTNTSDTTFTFKKTSDIIVSTSGEFNVAVAPTLEYHSYGTTGTLSALEKATIIFSLNDTTDITLSGTVSGTNAGTVLTGVGTAFTRLNIGDRIKITDVTGVFTVKTITNNLSLVIEETFPSTFSTKAVAKRYIAGDIIDLSSKGVDAGVTRSVSITNNKTLAFDLQETFSTTVSATVSFNAYRTTAKEISKILRPNRFVKFDCSTLASLSGPIDLGFSDVYKIRQIRKDTSAFTSSTQGIDVTSSFIFDNGQRDDFYDHAYITPKITLTIDDFLLVELDYFSPDLSQGVGYFSVDSYPVNDSVESNTTIFTHQIPVYKSPYTGATYDLRNHLDFRPVKTITASNSTTVAGASTNPTASDTFYSDVNGLRIPNPSSQVICDYSYYLARKDVIVSTTAGTFDVVKGVSAVFPVIPTVSETVMGIAVVNIPPYPSLATTYARILGKESQGVTTDKVTHNRFTMRDIGALKNRIANLEYYNTLTLLEKTAVDMLVPDENGLDRFKNGFFVDGFVDHSLGATYSTDYKIAVDKQENCIRPYFAMDSYIFNYIAADSDTVKTGNLTTLPYTESVLVEQPRVTTRRNVEQSVFRFIGKTQLTPDIDVWVDETVVDKTVEFGNDLPSNVKLTTEWGAWETYITGYNVYKRTAGERSGNVANGTFQKTYSTYAEAQAAAQALGRAYIETVQIQRRPTYTTSGTSEKEELGNFITDVSVVPYIRPQVIDVYIQGLKANTLMYLFFDGENMSDYVTPYMPMGDVIQLGTEGAAWRVSATGELHGKLRLPSDGKRFRVGTKEIIVTDSPTNAIDATTYSKSYFVASGLNAKKQNTIVSTKVVIVQEGIENNNQVPQKVEIFGPSCMAYSFKVQAPQGEPGVFLSSVDVFVESVHPTLGVWFEIREMNNAGGITRTQVPYSEVWYKSNEVITTTDGTVPHNVKFPSPVFLQNDTQYAFVIHTEGLNPDTYFWVSRLGETDIITNTPVTGRQLTGNLFTTNNNLNWSIVPDVDLKVRFNRATFTPTAATTAIFGNQPSEFFTVDTLSAPYTMFGEKITGSEIVTLGSITGTDTIQVGDIIQSAAGNFTIVGIDGSKYYTVDGVGMTVNDTVTITNQTGTLRDVTAVINVVEFGEATLDKYNQDTNEIKLINSNGLFFEGFSVNAGDFVSGLTYTITSVGTTDFTLIGATSNTVGETFTATGIGTGTGTAKSRGATLTGEFSSITANLSSIGSYKYSVLNMKPRQLELPGSACRFELRGVKSSDNTFGVWQSVNADSTYSMDTECHILSRSTEVATLGGDPSVQIRATYSATSGYTSPIIDMGSASIVFVCNVINDDTTGETNASGGNLLNKYISKTVTLADGQDAEDLMVAITAYIPPSSDVKVWMKIRHADDGDLFNSKNWIEMEREVPGVYSSLVNTEDFIDVKYKIPASYMTGANGEVQYTANGNTFSGFKQFAVKIGLLGSDSAIVPRVGDLRAIALQM